MEVGASKKCTPLWLEARFGTLLDVQMSLCVAGEQNVRVLSQFPKTMAGVGYLKRICKEAFSVAGAVEEICSSELLGGPGADFRRGVAFWSIRFSILGR